MRRRQGYTQEEAAAAKKRMAQRRAGTTPGLDVRRREFDAAEREVKVLRSNRGVVRQGQLAQAEHRLRRAHSALERQRGVARSRGIDISKSAKRERRLEPR